ncbi:hypothetical protein ACWIUA_07365 [Ursidibacter sp. B-7004-1]
MKIDVTAQELEMLRQQAIQDLLSSDGFGNPDLFDGDFVSHGRKKKNNSIENNSNIKQTYLVSIENFKKYDNQSYIFEQNGEFYELCWNVRSIPKIDFRNYSFTSKGHQNIFHQSKISSQIAKVFSSLLQSDDEDSVGEAKIKVIATNYKMRAVR